MALTLEEIQEQALKLPPDHREQLASSLWESLHSNEDPLSEFTTEQLAEFQRRSEAIRNGTVECISWEDAQREIDALF